MWVLYVFVYVRIEFVMRFVIYVFISLCSYSVVSSFVHADASFLSLVRHCAICVCLSLCIPSFLYVCFVRSSCIMCVCRDVFL